MNFCRTYAPVICDRIAARIAAVFCRAISFFPPDMRLSNAMGSICESNFHGIIHKCSHTKRVKTYRGTLSFRKAKFSQSQRYQSQRLSMSSFIKYNYNEKVKEHTQTVTSSVPCSPLPSKNIFRNRPSSISSLFNRFTYPVT